MATAGQSSGQLRSWHGFEVRKMPEVPSWVEVLGRAGYFAKGVVYAIIGVLAFKLAIGAGGEITGARGAIEEIGQQPFGRMLLGLTAIGLIGYCAWRLVQAIKDPDGKGSDATGIIARIGFVVSGLAYLALGIFAGSIALGFAGGSGSSGSGSSMLLGSAGGQVALGVVGAITIGVGIYFIYKAYRAKFMEKYSLAAMSENVRKAALYVGRFGLTTRGIAFAIVGYFILTSSINGTRDGEVSGISDALAAIAAQSHGQILLGIAGLGLICFAAHTILMGWYRRFNIAK